MGPLRRLLFVLLFCFPACGGDQSHSIEIGSLEALKASLFPSESGPSTPRIVNLWATWCAPCIAEIPDLLEATSTSDANGLSLHTISFDLMVPGVTDDAAIESVRSYMVSEGYSFPVFIYDEDDYEGINEALNLPGPIPVTLAFDEGGREVGRIEGAASLDEFRELVALALGGQ